MKPTKDTYKLLTYVLPPPIYMYNIYLILKSEAIAWRYQAVVTDQSIRSNNTSTH